MRRLHLRANRNDFSDPVSHCFAIAEGSVSDLPMLQACRSIIGCKYGGWRRDKNTLHHRCAFGACRHQLERLAAGGSGQRVKGRWPAAPSSASAAAPVCTVDMEKFSNMKEGMSRSQIERDIGCHGKVLSSGTAGKFQTVLLAWKGNSPSSKLRAVFRNDTLIAKAQLGLK